MPIHKLFFKETIFLEQKKLSMLGSEIATLDIDTDKTEAYLSFKPECKLIDKKIAERQAQSICKAGFLLESGERIGMGFKLIVTG